MLFSEPKIPQCCACARSSARSGGFSALQRAENSSIRVRPSNAPLKPKVSVLFSEPKIPQSSPDDERLPISPWFQCSSASRKFLNRIDDRHISMSSFRFSALQRAENSSICRAPVYRRVQQSVSVLFSEPKIPQSAQTTLYDEQLGAGFSALQRAENSSITMQV